MKKIIIMLVIGFMLVGCEKQVESGMPKFKYKKASEEATLNDDGYAIATLEACIDGDTATFKVNGLIHDTRFLAIDTPETSHPTIGKEPWGMAAKKFTCDILTNAKEIIIERDPESDIFDDYSRLLGWIWVDGELLNYLLVEESLAYVKYLYGDYEYTNAFIIAEANARKDKVKIHGEDDPDFDYDDSTIETTLENIDDIDFGKTVTTSGVVTGIVGKNMFIQDGDGAIYIYAAGYNYNAAKVGNKIKLTADFVDYNGLRELSNVVDKKIEILSEGNTLPAPLELTLDQLIEEHECKLIMVTDVVIEGVDVNNSNDKGYDVRVSKDGVEAIVRVDKYLDPMIAKEFFKVGETVDIIGNLGQYGDVYQIMIRTVDDLIRK